MVDHDIHDGMRRERASRSGEVRDWCGDEVAEPVEFLKKFLDSDWFVYGMIPEDFSGCGDNDPERNLGFELSSRLRGLVERVRAALDGYDPDYPEDMPTLGEIVQATLDTSTELSIGDVGIQMVHFARYKTMLVFDRNYLEQYAPGIVEGMDRYVAVVRGHGGEEIEVVEQKVPARGRSRVAEFRQSLAVREMQAQYDKATRDAGAIRQRRQNIKWYKDESPETIRREAHRALAKAVDVYLRGVVDVSELSGLVAKITEMFGNHLNFKYLVMEGQVHLSYGLCRRLASIMAVSEGVDTLNGIIGNVEAVAAATRDRVAQGRDWK